MTQHSGLGGTIKHLVEMTNWLEVEPAPMGVDAGCSTLSDLVAGEALLKQEALVCDVFLLLLRKLDSG